MFKNLRITCDEATTICDKSQYGASTLFDKIKLNIHFIRCKICSLYTKQNQLLTKLYKDHSKNSKEVTLCMKKEEKEALKKELEKI